MTQRPPILQLTWAGFDAAVYVIAAHCRRDRIGVHGVDAMGQLLAYSLSHRLGLITLPNAGPSMLEVHGVVHKPPASRWAWPDVDVWAWVDATRHHDVQSVVKATSSIKVYMPWQDAIAACRGSIDPEIND